MPAWERQAVPGLRSRSAARPERKSAPGRQGFPAAREPARTAPVFRLVPKNSKSTRKGCSFWQRAGMPGKATLSSHGAGGVFPARPLRKRHKQTPCQKAAGGLFMEKLYTFELPRATRHFAMIIIYNNHSSSFALGILIIYHNYSTSPVRQSCM